MSAPCGRGVWRITLAVAAVVSVVMGDAVAGAASQPARHAPRTRHDAAARTPATAASPAPTVARYRIAEGSSVDLGWTGIAHRQAWQPEQRLELGLDCGADGTCTVHGGEAGAIFGAPTPLSAGGVPVCAVSRLRAPLAGSVHPASGCGELRLALQTTVHTAGDVGRPCPVCKGDRKPNDGRKDGRCDGGAACDANSTSAIFGATSNDCLPPSASAVGTLAIDLSPLTTGTVELAADRDCKRRGFAARCFCAGQAQPNQCDSGACGDDETCDAPVDGVCARAPYRTCTPGSGERECAAVAAGSGACEIRVRRCFGSRIDAAGHCDRSRPTYAAIFCAPASQSPAINATAGLPGPARLRLVLEAIH